MSGRTALIALLGSVVGLVAGFILANSINRNELSVLRAENERFKTERPPAGTQDSNSGLSDEEISATIARADQNPNDFEVQRNIGVAIYRYGAMKQDEKLIRQSVRILERATGLRPDDFDVVLSLANAHFDVGYFSKDNDALSRARTFYEKALAAKPGNPDIQTDLGLTYFLQTPPNLDGAVGEFKKSLVQNPKHEKTLQFMVQTLIKQNKAIEASDYLERLRTVNPKKRLYRRIDLDAFKRAARRMKEALFILLILAVIVALTAIRYRRQIAAMLRIWRSLKSMRAQMNEKQSSPEQSIPAGPLVNCAKCGTWVPEQRAIKLRGGTFYCSSSCLESAVPAR